MTQRKLFGVPGLFGLNTNPRSLSELSHPPPVTGLTAAACTHPMLLLTPAGQILTTPLQPTPLGVAPPSQGLILPPHRLRGHQPRALPAPSLRTELPRQETGSVRPHSAGTCFLAPSALKLLLVGLWHLTHPVARAARGWRRRSGSRGTPQHLLASAGHLPIPHYHQGNTRCLPRGKGGCLAQIFTAPVSCLGQLSPEGSVGRRQQGRGSGRNRLLSAQSHGLQWVCGAPVSLCSASSHGLLQAYRLRCSASFRVRVRCGLGYSLCLCAREVKAAHAVLAGFNLPPPLPDPELPPRGIDPWSRSSEKGQARRAWCSGASNPSGGVVPPASLSRGLHPIPDSAGLLEQAVCAVAVGPGQIYHLLLIPVPAA